MKLNKDNATKPTKALQSTAYHEAGHAVAAWRHRIAIRRAKGLMGGFDDYKTYDGLGLADLVRTGQVRPEEILDAAVARIESLNPRLNAVVHTMYDEARRTIAAGLPKGAFAGVPFMLKDLSALYEGAPTTNGSRLFAGHVADHDSEIIRRYRAAGLVVIGKTNTPEFGLNVTTEPVMHGPTRNPWDPGRNPGGSSGGAAAAVASGMVPMAHATDGAVQLGNTWLSAENLSGYAGQLTGWQDALTSDADLLFYGCNLAQSEDGKTLIDGIAALTDADVAASTDDTGHAIFGADWELEYAAGQIETNVAFSTDLQQNWGHVLNVSVDAGVMLFELNRQIKVRSLRRRDA